MSLSRESPFRHKVVYSVHDGCSLWQKSIHHDRENTMLFSSISVINGWLFLCCSIVWWQICWTDYRTIYEELTSENKCIFALRERWRLYMYLFPVSQWFVYPRDMCIPTHISLVICVSPVGIHETLMRISAFDEHMYSGCLGYVSIKPNASYCQIQ